MKIAIMSNNIEHLSYGQVRDEKYIKEGLESLGVEISLYEVTDDTDLVLYFKNNRYSAKDVKKWREKAPVWAWTFDNMDRFSWFYPIAKECDLWLGEELGRRERFKKDGLPFYYFPYHAVPPQVFKKVKTEKLYDVVFTGTPYEGDYEPNKFELLKAIQEKFDLHIFGNNSEGWKQKGFKNVHEPVFDEKLSEVYGQSKIVVGISNCQCEGYWSIRSSQTLMCGAFHLVRYTPQVEKELKDNVVYFQDIPDCLAKIDYYLKNDKERQIIACKGYKYAQKYLTTRQRLKEFLILYENRSSI